MAKAVGRLAHILWCKIQIRQTFLDLIGEPIYETWLEYPNYAALDEDAEKAKEFAPDPKFQELVSQVDIFFFKRVNGRTVKEIQ